MWTVSLWFALKNLAVTIYTKYSCDFRSGIFVSYIFTPRDFDGPSFSGRVHFQSAPLRIRRESTCCAPVASGDESISNGRKQVRLVLCMSCARAAIASSSTTTTRRSIIYSRRRISRNSRTSDLFRQTVSPLIDCNMCSVIGLDDCRAHMPRLRPAVPLFSLCAWDSLFIRPHRSTT